MDTKTKKDGYTPRPGSKVSIAMKAMEDGPLRLGTLAKVLECPEAGVSGLLHQALVNLLVQRCHDAAEVLHFALLDRDLPGGFSVREANKGPSKTPDPKDPFGLVAAQLLQWPKADGQTGAASTGTVPLTATPPTAAPAVQKAAVEAPAAAVAPAVAPSVPTPAAHPAAAPQADVSSGISAKSEQLVASPGDFLAAVFSTGELMIRVGLDTLVLTPDHQKKLEQFVSRFGD